jgi:type II secretory pathway pseudopilin PulG
MHIQTPTGQRGFTYFMLLWWVAISGVVLAALSQQWAFERRREKEAEMVARAKEIVAAIAAYNQAMPGGSPSGVGPSQLLELVEDKRGPRTLRHLRRVWTDPLTGRADWGLVRQGDGPNGPLRGVFSRASGQPIRAPAGTSTYAAWHFEIQDAPVGP